MGRLIGPAIVICARRRSRQILQLVFRLAFSNCSDFFAVAFQEGMDYIFEYWGWLRPIRNMYEKTNEFISHQLVLHDAQKILSASASYRNNADDYWHCARRGADNIEAMQAHAHRMGGWG